MKQLQISEQHARVLYATATPEFKTVLEDTFGAEVLNGKVTDRIKTYEDACRELGFDPNDELSDDEMYQFGFTKDEIALRRIKVITKALNEGWQPDWNNANQKKWYPWFRMSSGGFVFDDAGYDNSSARAGYASRLCFKTEELARYAGEQFAKLYSDNILYYE